MRACLVFLVFFLVFFYLLFLLRVAYVTLLERHLLGLRQLRLGPSKTGIMGALQPFIDAFKLFQKGMLLPFLSRHFLFFFSPVFFFILLFFQVTVFQGVYVGWRWSTSLLFFICLIGLTVYVQFISGFFRTSKYGFLGSLRGVAQRVSFEVSLFFFVFFLMLQQGRLRGEARGGFYIALVLFPFLLLVLVELGRAPFDLLEGERELVSGYNVEYGGIFFVFLFLREYGLLLGFRVIFRRLLIGWDIFVTIPFVIIFVIFFLLCRRAFPRIRYDSVMSLFWFWVLPLGMHCVFLVYFIRLLSYILLLVVLYLMWQGVMLWGEILAQLYEYFFFFVSYLYWFLCEMFGVFFNKLFVLGFLVVLGSFLFGFFYRLFMHNPLRHISIIWEFYVIPLFRENFGLGYKRPVSSFMAPYLFIFLFFMLLIGIIPYMHSYLIDLVFVFQVSFTMWLISIFYVIHSKRFYSRLWIGDLGVALASFLFIVELLRTLIKPVTLTVRLYANLMFGHYLIIFVINFLLKFGGLGLVWLSIPFFLYELAVYVIQAYIFTYLVTSYFDEFPLSSSFGK